MPQTETIEKQKPVLAIDFLKLALNSVETGIKDLEGKGVGCRFDKDYCNGIVEALQLKPQFKDFSATEIKLALQPLFKAIVMSAVSKDLGIELKKID